MCADCLRVLDPLAVVSLERNCQGALWGVLGVSILIRCGQAIINPVPQRMQSAVGNAIMSLITLDAVLVLAFCGEQWSVTVLALLVWFVVGRRIAAVT